MNCRELLEQLESLLDGGAERSPALRQHLAICSGCRQLVATCRQTIHYYRSEPAPPIPAALHRKLMEKVNGKAAPLASRRPPTSS